MNAARCVVVLCCALSSLLTQLPAFSQSPDLLPTPFQESCQKLAFQFADPVVTNSFTSAQSNTKKFLDALFTEGPFASAHSAVWYGSYRTAITLAQKGDWKSAEPMLNTAISAKPEIGEPGTISETPKENAGLLLLGALANVKMSNYKVALENLRLLYELHKSKPESWTDLSRVFKSI